MILGDSRSAPDIHNNIEMLEFESRSSLLLHVSEYKKGNHEKRHFSFRKAINYVHIAGATDVH